MALVKVTGLDHIVLRCADIEKSLAFYCDTLGPRGRAGRGVARRARRRSRRSGSRRRRSSTCSAAVPTGRTSTTSVSSIEPTDLDALAASFPDAQRADHLFGAQGYASSLYIHDPDGNTIELRSYA